jgi:hypothetical protein
MTVSFQARAIDAAAAERRLRDLCTIFDAQVQRWAEDDDQGMNELLELVEDFRAAVRAEIVLTDRMRRGRV